MVSNMNGDVERKKLNYIEQLFLADLVNLDSSVDNIEFADFKIKKYTSEQLAKLFQVEKEAHEGGYFIVIKKDYPIKEKPEKKKMFLIPPFDLSLEDPKIFYKPILILNLFKENEDPVIFGRCYSRIYDAQKGKIEKHITNSIINFEELLECNYNGDIIFRKRYKLLPNDVPQLQRFSKAILPFISKKKYKKDERFLQIALTFFEDGIRKELNPDLNEMRLIDFMIALESLFLQKGPEIAYKFSNRVAMLVSSSDSEKQEVRRYAKKLYNLRSDIVHGASTKGEISRNLYRLECGQGTGFKCTVREILRRSILYFSSIFDNGYKKGKILEMLDDAIFDKKVEEKINCSKKKFMF